MKIAILFHKNPYSEATRIDLIRMRQMSAGLRRRGMDVEILAPVACEGALENGIPVRHWSALTEAGRYDLVKTCYHFSVGQAEAFSGPMISRIVRVVDKTYPERDAPCRAELLRAQEIIAGKASAVILNNAENAERWGKFYGHDVPVVLVPTGCPSVIPPAGRNPFAAGERVVIFLGSVASQGMLDMLNAAAGKLAGWAVIHLIGADKSALYGIGGKLSTKIIQHGELPEPLIWDYLRNADMGLALATGPHLFDNDISKIYNYLRAGLPVLAEDRIITNHLISETGHGKIFRFGDGTDLAATCLEMLDTDYKARSAEVMDHMIRLHSWDERAGRLADLIRSIVNKPLKRNRSL